MENKKYSILVWGLIILGIIGIVLGMLAVVTKEPVNNSPVTVIENKIAPDDQAKIQQAAKVTLIEYSDFQCPACKHYWDQIKQLETDFGDNLNIVYRYFPLEQIHKNALLSSQAAEAASKQNKFWEMSDLLFTNQDIWAENNNAKDIFVSYAEQLGLDKAQFEKDLDSQNVIDRVKRDEKGALSLGLQGTPTFFLNGNQIQTNPASYNDFKKLIENELNKQ